MVANGCTFRLHLVRVIRDLFRLLRSVLHVMETLVSSEYQWEAAASH